MSGDSPGGSNCILKSAKNRSFGIPRLLFLRFPRGDLASAMGSWRLVWRRPSGTRSTRWPGGPATSASCRCQSPCLSSCSSASGQRKLKRHKQNRRPMRETQLPLTRGAQHPQGSLYDLERPRTLNPYSYAGGNPTTWTDPDGLSPAYIYGLERQNASLQGQVEFLSAVAVWQERLRSPGRARISSCMTRWPVPNRPQRTDTGSRGGR